MPDVLLGLGSNLGDREAYLRQALSLLSTDVRIQLVSALYETDPVGYLEQGAFLNAVILGATELGPRELLCRAKMIEQELGRVAAARWGPRTVDVDILAYDELCLEDAELEIPHPRLAERAFALVPLAEIAPQWRHPGLAKTAFEMVAELGAVTGVRLYKLDWWRS